MIDDIYESFARMGNCMICKRHQDLRAGVCGMCSDRVQGEPRHNPNGKLIGHKLWDSENPDNNWIVGVL